MLFDSHPGPNFTFIIEISSQLFGDKMVLDTGQQLIILIKPLFDFICSDCVAQSNTAGTARGDNQAFSLFTALGGCSF